MPKKIKWNPNSKAHSKPLSSVLATDDYLRTIEDAFNEIQDWLTKEEKLFFSIFKNSKQTKNHIYRVFLKRHFGKDVSSSAITHKKKRILCVLYVVGELLRFKRSHNIDFQLKQVLTNKQHEIYMCYEKRMSNVEIRKMLGINKTNATISYLIKTAGKRIEQSGSEDLIEYKKLVSKVTKFSKRQRWVFDSLHSNKQKGSV